MRIKKSGSVDRSTHQSNHAAEPKLLINTLHIVIQVGKQRVEIGYARREMFF